MFKEFKMSNMFSDLIIFEMANNHQGDINHGLQIIKELGKVVRKYGINAGIKLQYRDLDTFIHPDFKDRTDVKHIPRFLQTRLTEEQFYQLICAIKEEGMHTICTPFDEASVDLCMDHGIEILKVASCSAVDWPLLEKIASTHKPVIISTGAKTYDEIDKIYNFFTHRNVNFAMLHCVGLYPAPDESIQLDNVRKMIDRYPGIQIGYSGHENPSDMSIAQMAIAKGATILERHVGLATDTIKLNAYSTDAREVYKWIESIVRARVICQTVKEKRISDAELTSMDELARGCFAKTVIKKGEIIDCDKVFFAMPRTSGQTTSGTYQSTMIATKDYAENEPIFEKQEVSLVKDIRSLIHDIKGMLYEAHIVVGNKFDLELSHHYGLQHFKHYGCTIISVINREYCKKLLILLPGQENPTHTHKIKEETFQVLYGTLRLVAGGEEKILNAGDTFTMERGVPHSFSSEEGCVFEEVSSTHIRNDSYYDDPRISSMDPMERKTILTDW